MKSRLTFGSVESLRSLCLRLLLSNLSPFFCSIAFLFILSCSGLHTSEQIYTGLQRMSWGSVPQHQSWELNFVKMNQNSGPLQ